MGIRGGPTVNSCHADAQRAQISSPWKRSKNRVVKDEWVLQTGALSPTFPFGKEGRDIQAQVRAHTSQGFHDRPQSPFSHASGHGASHHPVDPLKVQGSLSTIQLSTSQFSHTSSADGHKQPPTLWVQDRYFMRPKTQVLVAPSLRHCAHGAPRRCIASTTHARPQQKCGAIWHALAPAMTAAHPHSQRTSYESAALAYRSTAR